MRAYLCSKETEMDMMEYLELIVSFVIGGGLTSVLTGPWIKAKARADAMKSMQDVYQEMIADLRKNNEDNKAETAKEIEGLHLKIDEQNKVIGKNSVEIGRLEGIISHFVCYTEGCTRRQKIPQKK